MKRETEHDARVTETGETPTVTALELPGAIVLTVAGEIDMATSPVLENAVRDALTRTPKRLVIDLSGAEFFSSAGITVLMLAHSNRAGVALRVVAKDRVVLRPLELSGLTEDLAIHPDLESALAD